MRERFAPAHLMAARWFDPALAVLLSAVGVIDLLATQERSDSPLAAVGVVLFCAPIALRRRHPVAAACAQSGVLLVAASIDWVLPETLVVAVSVIAFSCGAHASRRDGLLAVGMALVGLQVEMGFADFPNVELLFPTFPAWWVGRQVRLRDDLVSALADRNRELEAEEDAFVRLSVRRERARIAHELHDIISHHLAVIVVQAGAGRMAIPAQEDAAPERFESIRDSGAHALAEMARLVDILHADGGRVGAGERLQLLLDQAHASGLDIDAAPFPRDLRLTPEMEDTAYRVVQEGLTNAMKHAPGAGVHVRVAALGELLEVEVRNEAHGAPSTLTATGSGLGLTGMRERIEASGGTLDAGPEPGGGWALRAKLPLAAGAPAPTR